jgi:hypothetical protein
MTQLGDKMLLGIQIFGVLFGLLMLYLTFIHYKRKEFTIKEYIFWFLLWIIFVIIALFPSILDPIVIELKFARTLDLLIITGFLFLIGSIFYTYTIVRANQKKLEEIVRKIAIEKVEKKE